MRKVKSICVLSLCRNVNRRFSRFHEETRVNSTKNNDDKRNINLLYNNKIFLLFFFHFCTLWRSIRENLTEEFNRSVLNFVNSVDLVPITKSSVDIKSIRPISSRIDCRAKCAARTCRLACTFVQRLHAMIGNRIRRRTWNFVRRKR